MRKTTLGIFLAFLFLFPAAAFGFPLTDSSLVGQNLVNAMEGDELILKPYSEPFVFDPGALTKEAEAYNEAVRLIAGMEALTPADMFPMLKDGAGLPAADFLKSLIYFNISPDGETLFGVSETCVPFTYDLSTRAVRLIKPDATFSLEYYDELYIFNPDNKDDARRFIEDDAVAWSKDSRYLSFAFPDTIFRYYHPSINILLVDCDKASVSLVFPDLPVGLSYFNDSDSDYTESYPNRAGFSEDSGTLYFISTNLRNAEGFPASRINALNLAGKTITPLQFIDSLAMTDKVIWSLNKGRVYSHLTIDRGKISTEVVLEEEGSSSKHILSFHDTDNMVALESFKITDMKANSFVALMNLETQGTFPMYFKIRNGGGIDTMILPAMEFGDDSTYQMHQFTLDEAIEILSLDFVRNRDAFWPINMTLSPDGRFLLMVNNGLMDKRSFLFIADIQTGCVANIPLPDDFVVNAHDGWYGGAGPLKNLSSQGLRWLGNNKIMINSANGAYRLYELATRP